MSGLPPPSAAALAMADALEQAVAENKVQVSPPSDHATSSTAPPTKGLLLRVKRRRSATALETLVVSSERAEKRAALVDLRQSFAGANLASAPSAASAAAAADGSASSSSGAAAAAEPMFRARGPAAPATQRVFRLLTSTMAPKEAHGRDSAIVARVASLRARAAGGRVNPAVQSTVEGINAEHRLAQQLSSGQKRQVRLDANREKLAALQQSHLAPRDDGPQLVCDSDELQLQIVDIALPASGSGPGGVLRPSRRPEPFRTTFEPPPMTMAEVRKHSRLAEKAQRTQLDASSHRGVSSNGNQDAAGGAGAGVLGVDPHEAARQFTEAMHTIKRMPGDRKQMDAYAGLLEDYLSTLPPTAASAATAAAAAAPAATPVVAKPAIDSASLTHAASIPSPSTNRLAPKIPLRRKKPAGSTAPVHMEGDLIQLSSVDEDTQQQPTAGGLPYNPALLVPATGTSLHAAAAPTQPQHTYQSPPPAMGEPTSSSTAEGADEVEVEAEADYVYDVYHLPDEPMDTTSATVDATAAGESDEYKSQYHGASSAYVVLKDGLMSWVGGGEELVNEHDEHSDAEDAAEDEDDEGELSDYPEDEDSSANEEGGASDQDDDDDRGQHEYDPRYNAHTPAVDVWKLPSTHAMDPHSLMHLKKTAPRRHGFYAEEADSDDEDGDDRTTRDVRRHMAAGRDLSSDEEEGDLHFHRHQEDEEYQDTINMEAEMEDEREEAEAGANGL